MWTLMNKSYPVLELELDGGVVTSVGKVLDQKRLPVILSDDVTAEKVNLWLQKRRMPKDRDGYLEVAKIHRKFDTPHYMMSMSDHYWFRNGTRDKKWEQISPYVAGYSEAVGKLFFEPWTVADEKIIESPDLMTNGMLKKRWIKKNDGHYLLKAGHEPSNQHPVTEVLASMTLKKLDLLDYVESTLFIEGVTLCSMSRSFIDADTEFVPASHLYQVAKKSKEDDVYQALITICKNVGIDAKDQLDRMIICDHFIGNYDRHLGNFGLIRNVETAEYCGFAPLFDHGSAYSGTKKGYIFENYKKSAINTYAPLLAKVDTDASALYSLLEAVPGISEAQKDFIKDNISTLYQQLDRIKDMVEAKKKRTEERDR